MGGFMKSSALVLVFLLCIIPIDALGQERTDTKFEGIFTIFKNLDVNISTRMAAADLYAVYIEEGRLPIVLGQPEKESGKCEIFRILETKVENSPCLELEGVYRRENMRFKCVFVFYNDVPQPGPILMFYQIIHPSVSLSSDPDLFLDGNLIVKHLNAKDWEVKRYRNKRVLVGLLDTNSDKLAKLKKRVTVAAK